MNETMKEKMEVARQRAQENLHSSVDSPWNHTIIMSAEAVETCREVDMLLADLRNVAMNMEGEDKVTLEQEIHTMEMSWMRAISAVMFTMNKFDKWVRVTKDSHLSLFWIHPSSGYHGGLLFHQHWTDGTEPRFASHELYKNGQKFPIGRWSIHT